MGRRPDPALQGQESGGGTVEFRCVPRRMVEEAYELANSALDMEEEDVA